MPKKLTEQQRREILDMLEQGFDRDTIAAQVNTTPGQVSAVSAHVKMGTYQRKPTTPIKQQSNEVDAEPRPIAKTINLLDQLRELQTDDSGITSDFSPVLLGTDAESNQLVYWNPDPATGSANPHVLVLGESGFGKTYTISCLLAELAQQGVLSIVFDYGQGFALESAPTEFVEWANPIELLANRDGIDINPLQIFPSDLHGPLNVATSLRYPARLWV